MIQQFISYIKGQDARFIFLALMLIVLPSFEVPKNLFAVLFATSWVFISYRSKNWGGKWRAIDRLMNPDKKQEKNSGPKSSNNKRRPFKRSNESSGKSFMNKKPGFRGGKFKKKTEGVA